MVYGSNVLTNNWVIQNGYMLGSALVLHAGGIASQNVTATEIAIVPEKLLLEIDADRYAVRYTPIDTVQFEISYNNFTSDSILVPLNQVVEITPKSDIKETFVVTIRVSQPTTISAITLKIPQSIGGIQENTDYFGVSISRNYGLRVEKSNGASEAIFNSDVFEMNAKDTQGVMRKRIYFDPVAGNYIFDGLLSATAIEAVSAEIDVVVSETIIVQNLYAEKGHIAELTVDQLETSNKVWRRLNNDISDLRYIKVYGQNIEFITATTTGTASAQLLNRKNQPLFWKDEQSIGYITTLETTPYPVMIYVYEEIKPMALSFEQIADELGTLNIPVLKLGRGDGVLPNSSTGRIFKGRTGIVLEYFASDTANRRMVTLNDTGVTVEVASPDPTKPQVRNIYTTSTLGSPSTENLNEGDLWLVWTDIP